MNFDINTILTIVVVVAVVFAIRSLPRLMTKAKLVEAEELKKRMDAGHDVLVIDVRTPKEFDAEGHIAGALNLPLDQVATRLKDISGAVEAHKGQDVYLICRTDNRSLSAAGIFRKAGFENILVVKHGMARWRQLNYPTA